MQMRPPPDHDELNDFHRLIFETSPQAILWVDAHGRVLRANAAARELPWSTLERALLHRWTRDPEILAFRAELHARGGASLEIECRFDVKAPPRHLALEGRRFGSECVLILRDATMDRRLEEEASALRGIATIGEIAATVVHDFGNVLGPIACIAQALEREVAASSSAGPLVEEIVLASRRALDVWRELIELVRREPSHAERVDVGKTLTTMRPLLERLAGPQVEIALQLDGSAGETNVRRVQLERVILNLVANARDAMPSGGHIVLRTHLVVADEERARDMGCPSEGPYLAITVTDDGAGMSEEVQARAFERFFSTKEGGRGTGLGLAAARRFAAEAGGSISVRSEIGDGTVVSLYLPRAPAMPTTSLVVGPSASNGDGDQPSRRRA